MMLPAEMNRRKIMGTSLGCLGFLLTDFLQLSSSAAARWRCKIRLSHFARGLIGWFMVVALVTALPGKAASANEISHGKLGSGTSWETPWWIIDSGKPGATVLLVGGMHGNEPAGFRAAEQIRHWPIIRGKLLVLPKVNRLGLAANLRWAPEYRNDREKRDLNRNFPRDKGAAAITPLCQAIWAFVSRFQPEWVFDLHEGFDVHRINPKSVGSSIITFPGEASFARIMLDAVNKGITPERHFSLLSRSGPVNGSLARACHRLLGAKSFILETTSRDQPVSLRARQHRVMISMAFLRLGMTDRDLRDVMGPRALPGLTRVGVFDAAGANEAKVLKVIGEDRRFFACHVGPQDMSELGLQQFEVMVFPGGSGSKQGGAIGADGRENVRRFVRKGGGVVGICAGAYLCSSHYKWSLNLMNASVFNKMVEVKGRGRKSMWYRGKSTEVRVEFTDEGAALFGLEGTHSIRYHNGPILSPGNTPSAPAYRALAFFRTENGIYEAQKGTMIGAPAVVVSDFGKGKVLAISPHFESTRGKEQAILKAIDYVRR